MSDTRPSAALDALLAELLAAIKDNIPVARGWGGCSEASFRGSWLVMDKDCAERVKKAAAAVRHSTSRDSAISGAGGRPSSEARLQELLAAIEANKPLAAPDIARMCRFSTAMIPKRKVAGRGGSWSTGTAPSE